jgi:hypothetical protein
MTKLKTVSVADVLERELEPTIKEWLRRVNLVPELTAVTLSDADRTGHLPKLYSDLISRLRLVEDSYQPISVAAAVHGRKRRVQGYSAAMLVEESRVFQVATFCTLHLHHNELDKNHLLSDIMVIADEVDAQLTQAIRSFAEVTVVEDAA